MNNKKFKIIIDSNSLRSERKDEGFSNILKIDFLNLIKDFLEQNKINKQVKICIPEMVLKERACQVLESIKDIKDLLETNFEILKGFGLNPDGSYKTYDYKESVEKKLENLTRGGIFEEIKIPEIEPKTLIERAIRRVPPFCKKDKGFKDTIIWLSILNDAKENLDVNYVFLTQDNDFKDELLKTEFKNFSKSNFEIVAEFIDLKKHLDLEINLNLQLEEISRKIKMMIQEEAILSKIEKTLNEDKTSYFVRDYSRRFFIEEFFISQSCADRCSIKNIEKINDGSYESVLIIPVQTKLGAEESFANYSYSTSPSISSSDFNTRGVYASDLFNFTDGSSRPSLIDAVASFSGSASLSNRPMSVSDFDYSLSPSSYNQGQIRELFFQIKLNISKDFKTIKIEKIAGPEKK